MALELCEKDFAKLEEEESEPAFGLGPYVLLLDWDVEFEISLCSALCEEGLL